MLFSIDAFLILFLNISPSSTFARNGSVYFYFSLFTFILNPNLSRLSASFLYPFYNIGELGRECSLGFSPSNIEFIWCKKLLLGCVLAFFSTELRLGGISLGVGTSKIGWLLLGDSGSRVAWFLGLLSESSLVVNDIIDTLRFGESPKELG